MTGPRPTIGQVLVLAPNVGAPSGAVVAVDGASANDDGTTKVTVHQGGPADAYAEGTVNAIGTPAVTAAPMETVANNSSGHVTTGTKSAERLESPGIKPLAVSLNCDNSVDSSLHGVGVTPSLTPTVTALWKHPLFGGGGFYVGTGGLSLFQFDLDGSISLNLGVTVSGSSTCHLNLPALTSTIPAGQLGAIILRLQPSLTLKVTGKVDIRTSVKLTCGAEYRWDQGAEYRTAFCAPSHQPLQLSADSGVEATLTASLAASITLDDLIGIEGNVTGVLHAGYLPTQHPVAEVDASVSYALGACLACFWSGSPAHVTLFSGQIFRKILATDGSAPTHPAPTSAPRITTAQLPDGTVGQPYSTQLKTADNRNGTWRVSSGSLPVGLSLAGDYIAGKPTTPSNSMFRVSFSDASGGSTDAHLTIRVLSNGPEASGAVQNLDYCRLNTFSANDDNSTDVVHLPFAMNFHGSQYSSLYVSNNGYVTFDGGRSDYTPFELRNLSSPMIAPFFADVDTRNPTSNLVTYGASTDGKTFCVNWVDVGYFREHADKTNSFQLLITNRSDVRAGDFDIVFNYGSINWETGDASDGTGGIGGTAARSGYTDGSGDAGTYELPGSGQSGALLNGGPHALVSSSANAAGVTGRYVYGIRN